MDQGVDKGVTENLLVSNYDFSVLEKCVGHEASVQASLENKEDMKSLGMVHDHENNKIGVVEAITPPEKEAIESSISVKVANEDPSYRCQTPRENIFDPFAPGPKEVACAPKKKVIRVAEVPSRRQQGFDSGDYPVKRLNYEFDDCEEDDQFLDRICKMFIDLIISKQALETTGEGLIDSSSPVSCETPSSAPLLTGIADVCPDAPLRRSVKVVHVSPRKTGMKVAGEAEATTVQPHLDLARGIVPGGGSLIPFGAQKPNLAPCEVCQEGTLIPFAPPLHLVLIFQVTSRVDSQILMDQGVDKGVTENLLVSNYDFSVVQKCVGDEASMQAPLENKEDMKSLGTVHDHENNKIGDAGAITPPEKETIESSISVKVANEYPSYGCQTPRENIFDPFAPGPEEAACAPKKVIKVPEVPSRRQLSFDSGEYPVKRLNYEFDDCEEDDQFLERIWKMFIDLIISKQALERTGEGLIDSSSPVRCETPSSAPLLTGMADVCPDAPLRQPVKAVQLSPSICRKLNFDSISPRSLFIKENK
uniref:Uncharacterized protein n=2 Tax=Leersia perrieri TaxID=77586 RepID=A0A0D9XWB7_9ORYZ